MVDTGGAYLSKDSVDDSVGERVAAVPDQVFLRQIEVMVRVQLPELHSTAQQRIKVG